MSAGPSILGMPLALFEARAEAAAAAGDQDAVRTLHALRARPRSAHVRAVEARAMKVYQACLERFRREVLPTLQPFGSSGGCFATVREPPASRPPISSGPGRASAGRAAPIPAGGTPFWVPVHDQIGEVEIAGAIGPDTGGIVRRRIRDLAFSGAKALLVTIDSPGGNCASGFAAYDALRKFSAETGPVVGFIGDRACSMATVVALACDFLVVGRFAEIMTHAPSNGGLSLEADRIRRILSDRTSIPERSQAAWLAHELTIEPGSAMNLGIADRVGDADVARAYALAAVENGRGVLDSDRQSYLSFLAAQRAQAGHA